MNSFKKLKVIAALSTFIFIGIAAVKQPVNDEFKNLQVLPKNITKDSLDKIMDGFNRSLGVDCKNCHVYNKELYRMDFDKDDKPEKEIARNMLRMTMDINNNYFQFNETATKEEMQAVTCYTCHRGEQIPKKER
jgi:Photosynthetic reaction centre cytochrome C subunit